MTAHTKVSPERIRRRWFNLGCNTEKLAAELGITRQAVHAAIKRAGPLTAGQCPEEDQRALNRAARLLLAKHGVTVPGLREEDAPPL